MTSINFLFLSAFMILATGCAHLEKTIAKTSKSNSFNEADTPNQFGWSQSNCAHITADGNCAQPL